jgi:hypothetical protein
MTDGAMKMKISRYFGWWRPCPALLERIAKWAGERRVIEVVHSNGRCLESDPCQGHGNMVIELDDGDTLSIATNSVGIGVVQTHYFPESSTHFSGYARGYNEWRADCAKMQRVRVAVLLCFMARGLPRDLVRLIHLDVGWESEYEMLLRTTTAFSLPDTDDSL